eukprot:COSAG01_NODE_17195_length_1171_cov_1.396455_1_plen_99_part_10
MIALILSTATVFFDEIGSIDVSDRVVLCFSFFLFRAGVGERGGKGRTKVVSRLNLLLEGEEPESMEKRRQVAEANRVEEEQRLRYRERLKKMPAILQAT